MRNTAAKGDGRSMEVGWAERIRHMAKRCISYLIAESLDVVFVQLFAESQLCYPTIQFWDVYACSVCHWFNLLHRILRYMEVRAQVEAECEVRESERKEVQW